ncbi:AraC family transcriptional regulator [Mucilaginibacter achroorhodeus]|uniref:AraC family transcriptional regulator n=1 Tax=Mucilaginibacter achroorhodeus TaxID=2599294 RepID=A0A563U4D6_9SPHI|nr:helix-turn-helix domain-containing protein [Mucilaginibacter achroorhodeus]TWR26214.1 AraC family transcriptional regulator [Mucilaginibacter achroorhodeus]
MFHQEYESPLALKEAIKCFWYTDKDFGDGYADFEVVPDGYAEIIFQFSEMSLLDTSGLSKPMPSPFMVGLLNQPLIFRVKGRMQVIGIRCYPWTVFDLLELPAGKEAVKQFEHPIAGLHPILTKFIKQNEPERAIDTLKSFFLNYHVSLRATDATLFKAGNSLTENKGSVGVSSVAEAAHATVRTLERKFKQATGHTVKDVAGLMRFEQVRNRLWSEPKVNLAQLANEVGYVDQAHLTREFKRYSGTTPAAFTRKAKLRQESYGDDFVAFVQS